MEDEQKHKQIMSRGKDIDALVLSHIMSQKKFCVKCRFCGMTIESRFSRDFQKCKCGAVAIDGGANLKTRRLIGNLKYFNIVDME